MNKPGHSLSRPTLQLETFFAGATRGWGFMHSRFGGLSQQFEIEAEGMWDEGARTLLLTEDYRFDDGHRDVLKWRIVKKSTDRYVGEEPRLKGEAEGSQADNHFRWTYTRDVPQANGSSTRLAFDDCFYLQAPDLMMARASVSRFGFEVGVITVTYLKS